MMKAQGDNGGTNYSISVEVHALPSASKRHISRTDSGRDTGSLESDGWGENERRGGWLAAQIEQFTSNKLLGGWSGVTDSCLETPGAIFGQ